MSAHVLIVDDDGAIREMLAHYLRDCGYRIDTAVDGEAGVAFCRESCPDLVMCDVRMPGMDGIALLGALKAAHPDLPVIIVSGTGEMDDAIQALRLGAWDYVTKPILDFAVLDHALERALERARLIAENRAYRDALEATNRRLEGSLRQLEDDEAAGQRIQFTMMPDHVKRYGEFECSRFLKTSAFLSGDFVDYFSIDATRFAVYMADVSGHGVSSAVITVMLKSYVGRHLENFRHYGDGTIGDPARLLGELNRDLLAGRHGKYLTMFYAVVDRERNRMVYANAGQYPFPWLFDDVELRQIGGKSPPVGLFDDAEYANSTLELPPRFSLTVFSDGVLEMLAEQTLEARKAHLERAAGVDSLDARGLAAALGIDERQDAPDDASILNLRRVTSDG